MISPGFGTLESMGLWKKTKRVDVGSKAPDFRLTQLDGIDATLSGLVETGPVVLAFFKISCPVCQFTLPYLERIHASGALRIYGISQNDEEDTREFARHFGLTFPLLLDREDDRFPASNAYGITHVPTLYLVGRAGMVVRLMEGWTRQDIQWLGAQAGMDPIRADEAVPEWKAG